MVLAPLPSQDQGRGWPSSLRVDSRTRPVSCNGLRREGGQGSPTTGSALEQPSAWWLKLERGDALLPKIDLCAPRTTRLFLSPVGPAPAGPPFRLSARPRLELQSLLMHSCAGRVPDREKALLIAALRDLELTTWNGDASILNDLTNCDNSTSHATADGAVVVSASKLAAEMRAPVSLPVQIDW